MGTRSACGAAPAPDLESIVLEADDAPRASPAPPCGPDDADSLGRAAGYDSAAGYEVDFPQECFNARACCLF